MDKEVSQMIVELLEQNQFGKNFGPKWIMSELRRHNIAEERIPSQIQIQNKLSYYRQTVFNSNNENTPLQDKVRLSIFNGEEAVDKPFVFVYDVDNTNRLVPIVQ
jgi:endo-1,4-beta-mannosidase